MYPPDSDAQQTAVLRVADHDAFNWGYDPVRAWPCTLVLQVCAVCVCVCVCARARCEGVYCLWACMHGAEGGGPRRLRLGPRPCM